MCFTGDNSNQDAFLYGSLLLMFVPVTAIGGLLYWAYRRIQAHERPPEPPAAPDVSDAQQGSPVLRVVPRQ